MKLTAESFLTVVKKSGLIQPEQLKKLLGEFQQQGVTTDDSHTLATALVERSLLTQWQADKLQQGKTRGFFLGKYRLLSLLGKGGMSSVYLAEHVLMRRRSAIKVLPQKRVHDSSYLGRFHREAQAVASLDHPNIVRAYDVDMDANVEKNKEIHFLVMEYVEGLSLQELVAKHGVLDSVTAADYARQGADGLAHAHESGMVHRDIKPGNLLVDTGGTVKMLDLGLARFFDDDNEESLTLAHEEKVLGTADYLAPEQALDSHTVDARADIYSLGCTIYYLLTGHPPFTTGTLAQRLMAHQTREPPPIEGERDGVDPELLAIIRKMMAKHVDERFQTAIEVSEALTAWLIEHGGDEWTAAHPGLSGSGSGPLPAVVSGSSPTIPIEPAVPSSDDGSLADFLSNLESTPSDSGIRARKRSGKSAAGTALLGDSSGDVVVPATVAGETPAPSTAGQPIAVPARPVQVAQPVAVPARTATAPQPAAAQPTTAETESIFQKTGVRIGIIAAAAALLLGGGVWAAVAFWGNGDSNGPGPGEDPEKKTNPGPNTKAPSKELIVVPSKEFPTIAKAIEEVKRRFDLGDRKSLEQTIRVTGGKNYSERITLISTDSELDELKLKIVCDGETPAVLDPKGPEPVVKLVNMQNFTLEGFDVKADKAADAVHVEGYSAGLLLNKLSISGFTSSGIKAVNLQGFIANQNVVVLRNLRFRTTNAKAVGLRFTGESSRVEIRQCRFLGPMGSGIVFQNDTFFSQITHCVFHKLKNGIHFSRPLRLGNLTIRNNTFHDSAHGIVFANMPTGSTDMVLSSNLFAKIRTNEAIVQKPKKIDSKKFQEFLANGSDGMQRNMTDRKAPPKNNIPFFFREKGREGVKVKFQSTDPDDENFLLPQPGAVHSRVGANGSKE